MKGVFITGTDTDVGKTFVSALLAKAWNSNYWKPIQTGLNSCPLDTETVKDLSGLPDDHFEPPRIELQEPLSPWRAAILENTTISIDEFDIPHRFKDSDRPIVVEGAGGLFVPITETKITTDLIQKLGFPVILVARSGLGTINHTLLSIEHLRSRNIRIVGIVLDGKPNPDNAAAIVQFAKDIPIICQVPEIDMSLTLIDSLLPLVPKFEILGIE
jgi:dethiobiotin synthetase